MPRPARDFTKVGPNEGERLPEIRLPDQSGVLVDVHAVRGERKALVVFYRSADW
jgi:peroxiredoxin